MTASPAAGVPGSPSPDPRARRTFSARRIKKAQELRAWHVRRNDLRPAEMHRIVRLTRSRERGWLQWTIPPILEAALFQRRRRSQDKPGFVCGFTGLLLLILWKCCIERRHSHLQAAHRELAGMLGCAWRTVQHAVVEAAQSGWMVVTPLFAEVHHDGRCRCDHHHSAKEAPCTECPCAKHQDAWEVRCRCGHTHGALRRGACDCGCPRFRPLQHRQLANGYAPGPRLLEVAMHLAEQQQDLEAMRHWTARRCAAVQQGAGLIDLEDRNQCDPSPCEDPPADLPPPSSPRPASKLPRRRAPSTRGRRSSGAPPAATTPAASSPVDAAPPPGSPPVAAPVACPAPREEARGLSATSRPAVAAPSGCASAGPEELIEGGSGPTGAGADASVLPSVGDLLAELRKQLAQPRAVALPTAPPPAPTAPRAEVSTDPRKSRPGAWRPRRYDPGCLRGSPYNLSDQLLRVELSLDLTEAGWPEDDRAEVVDQLWAAQRALKWEGAGAVCQRQPDARGAAVAEVVRIVERLLGPCDEPAVREAQRLLRVPLSAEVLREAAVWLDGARATAAHAAAALLRAAAQRAG